jgi:hypothetical protein
MRHLVGPLVVVAVVLLSSLAVVRAQEGTTTTSSPRSHARGVCRGHPRQ